MRTTVNVDDLLLARARAVAAESRRTVSDVIDDALRVLFAARDAPPDSQRRVRLPTLSGTGLRPGVDLEDREALAELLGDNRLPGASA